MLKLFPDLPEGIVDVKAVNFSIFSAETVCGAYVIASFSAISSLHSSFVRISGPVFETEVPMLLPARDYEFGP